MQGQRSSQDPTTETTEQDPVFNVGLFEDFVAPGAEELDYVRLLSVPAIVAELRRVVANPHSSEKFVQQASRQLARLAEAGVPGAAPDEWWGSLGVSEHAAFPIRTLSPSTLEKGLNCPMNATLSKLSRLQEATEPIIRGNLVHGYFEATATGADKAAAAQLIKDAFSRLVSVPPWLQEATNTKWDEMIRKLDLWLQVQDAATELVGMEVPVDVTLPNGVRINGRIDRVDATDAGYRIIDLKTGNSTIYQGEVDDHRQLEAYQLAFRHGRLVTNSDGESPSVSVITAKDAEGLEVDTAVIVQPTAAKKDINVREQARKSDEELDALAAQLPELMKNLTGPRLLARVGKACDHCSFINICPAQVEGEIIPKLEEETTNEDNHQPPNKNTQLPPKNKQRGKGDRANDCSR